MKKYTFLISGQDDEGYLNSELVNVMAHNETEAESEAESRATLNGPYLRLIGISE